MKAAKAAGPENQSNAIVVSFAAAWYEAIRDLSFSAVIRKRVPKTVNPDWLYFHVNAPVGAICARAPIKKVSEVSLAAAKRLSKVLNLSPNAIDDYVGDSESIGCYDIGPIVLAMTPVKIETLRKHLTYYPPQSFFILSLEGKQIVDELAGFRP